MSPDKKDSTNLRPLSFKIISGEKGMNSKNIPNEKTKYPHIYGNNSWKLLNKFSILVSTPPITSKMILMLPNVRPMLNKFEANLNKMN